MSAELTTAGPLRVLVVAHDARAPGGVNNFLRIMRRRIRGRICAVRFANGRRHGETGTFRAIRRMLSDYFRFACLLLRRPFDLVHINPSLDLTSMPREFLLVWIARIVKPRGRVVIFYRGWDWDSLATVKRHWLTRRLFLATQRRADRILVLAESFRRALIDLGVDPKRVHLATTMFEGEILAKALAEDSTKSGKNMLFLARFVPGKGARETIQAMALLADRHPSARLVMAGDGPDRAELEELATSLGIADRIEFPGYVLGMDKMRILARTSIFILPTSYLEGMPNAILEAMAAGAVIVTTPVGGIPSIVKDGENGTVLESDDPANLADAIDAYLSSPEQSRAIGERNRALAWSTWESGLVSGRIADHYEELVRGH